MFSVFGRTEHSVSTLRMYFILWNIFINFHLSHWEKYNTGVLFLPWSYDASMLGTIIVFTITYIYGHDCWKFDLPGGFTAGTMFEIFLYFSSIISSLPVVLWNIYLWVTWLLVLFIHLQMFCLFSKYCRSYRDGTGKMRSFSEAMRPLVSLVVLFTICTLWVVYSPTDIVNRDPRIVFFTVGTMYSNICVSICKYYLILYQVKIY